MHQAFVRVLAAGALTTSVFVVQAQAEPVAPDAVIFEDGMVQASLTGIEGNPEEGTKVFVDRRLGNCLACHANAAMGEHQFHGEVGPSLDGVADRWEEAEIRGIVADSKEFFGEETVMPGFYSLNVGVNVRKDLVGKTILTAQQVEDVVAYLLTLKEE